MHKRERRPYLKHHREEVLIGPGSSACPHLQYNTSYTPYVDFGIVPLSLLTADNFGGHPKHGTLHRGIRRLVVVSTLRNSEVRDLADASLLNKNIVGFKVLRKKLGGMSLTVRESVPYG